MNAPVFFAAPDRLQGDTIALPPEEAYHAKQVLRLATGDRVVVVDGEGMAFRGEIVDLKVKRSALVQVHDRLRNMGEPRIKLTLAAGLSTAQKFDSVIQKGTELGVSRFVPLLTEKSKVTLDDPRRVTTRVTRLSKVALAAMKQCRRCVLPEIVEPMSMGDFLSGVDRSDTLLMFHPDRKAVPLSSFPEDELGPRITALVGPESGFSAGEIVDAVKAGFEVVTLGDRILRSETAGPAVCALLMFYCGELN
jgi:16S rRNA (uracil1498-N3)-methyltransferase